MTQLTSGEPHIPNEILLEILHQALPRMDEEGRLDFQTIRSVCSRWRSTSFSSPVLWSSVTLRCENSDHRRYITLLERWFSRAGSSIPLELEYVDRILTRIGEEEKVAMKAFVQRHQQRWRSLKLFINADCLWSSLITATPCRWDNLQTLKLFTYSLDINDKKRSEALDALEQMTSLRCLRVTSYDTYNYQHTRHLGPIGLVWLHLTLNHLSLPHFNLLASYRNLNTLIIVTYSSELIGVLPDHHLTLPFLISLKCIIYDLSPLRHFTTPSLVNFTLGVIFPDEADNDTLEGFLTRCTDTLTSFTLEAGGTFLNIANTLKTLAIRPGILHLALSSWPSKSEHMEDGFREWCPKLRDLILLDRFETEAEERDSMEGLATFLRRREGWGMRTLEQLTVRRRAEGKFPRELFEGVTLGRICVMVPWQ
jgi:F-box-like